MKNKRLIFVALVAILFTFMVNQAEAQDGVGIGTTDVNADAILEIESTTKGLLIPRMTTVERNTLPTPHSEGLVVFDITLNSFMYWDGARWQREFTQRAQTNLNMNNKQITNVPDATGDQHAVNRRVLMSEVVPAGGIIMWSGASVPSGWGLCNGTGGRPDLRNRFIMGGSGTTSTGGASTSSTTNIIYDPQSLWTSAPANCSIYQNRYTGVGITTGGSCGTAGVSFNFTNVPSTGCVAAARAARGCNNAQVTSCTTSSNPQYYIGNANCATGATSVRAVTGTENRPAYYVLAFIMKL